MTTGEAMDHESVLGMLRDVADEAILPRFRSLAADEVMEKNPGDPVTIADREAELLIAGILGGAYPGAVIVGEEATAADPGLLDRLPGAGHVFLVDPVDGTKNFVAGSPDFAVMVAELRDGVVVRAWIYQPVRRRSFVAELGAGAYADGARLERLQPSGDVHDLRVLGSRKESQGRRGAVTVSPTFWSCGVDYPALAMGLCDALLYTRGMPWDHAPGSLLIHEVGGVVRHQSGSAYDPARVHHGGLLAAGSELVWESVAAEIDDTLTRPPG